MPSIIDYPQVRDRLLAAGLVSNYYNGGAFGFPKTITPAISGWIGPDDPSIRPEMKPRTHQVPPPYEQNLATDLTRAWTHADLGAEAWIMPLAHWAFELDFGHAAWLPRLLTSISIDPHQLHGRTDAAAIAFNRAESAAFIPFIERLLAGLTASDFIAVFPDSLVLCTLHHHRQLWWQTKDQPLLDRINAALSPA